MNEEMIPPREMFLGPLSQELSTSGLHVEEALDVERIELAGRVRGPEANLGWETVQAGGDSIDLLPDPEFELNLDAAAASVGASPHELRLERESLELAAELATLRAAAAERERALEARIVELTARLDKCEHEIADQSEQIAALASERDGLRARLDGHGSAPSRAGDGPARQERRVAAGLAPRPDERDRALAAAREELECLRAEQSRLAGMLAEREAQVSRLLDEINRRETRRRFDGDFRGALQRLIGAARRRGESDERAPARADDDHDLGAAATDTVVLDPPPLVPGPEPEVASSPPADPQRATPRRFLLSMEPGSGDAHELAGARVYVGRAREAGVRIPDTTVSRVHAVLRLDGERVTVEDLASRNGVFVNGIKVRSAVLDDFDTVTFGNVGYLFRLGPAADEATLRGTQ
ncbi:MAG: FHA domain-containing protein [Steroidobacteraceae bacterium]|jgi:hypothetical protein|nr:FHA domain-containing protein [Steroidobacteraceae bacterium]